MHLIKLLFLFWSKRTTLNCDISKSLRDSFKERNLLIKTTLKLFIDHRCLYRSRVISINSVGILFHLSITAFKFRIKEFRVFLIVIFINTFDTHLMHLLKHIFAVTLEVIFLSSKSSKIMTFFINEFKHFALLCSRHFRAFYIFSSFFYITRTQSFHNKISTASIFYSLNDFTTNLF